MRTRRGKFNSEEENGNDRSGRRLLKEKEDNIKLKGWQMKSMKKRNELHEITNVGKIWSVDPLIRTFNPIYNRKKDCVRNKKNKK